MNGAIDLDSDDSAFVEVDPTGRYRRYSEILGKGSSKTVYRAFDEYEGIEVAWNQVKLYDFLQSPEDLERLYCEIHLLKTLKHDNIMKFYTSWVDTANRNINFVTEMFTSGTLRQYRLKHKRVNIRAIKHWCRQILQGLLFLHSHDPPVIHRDLKCDNIFINGNQGEVKIGDLGLAAILRKSYAARCVGKLLFLLEYSCNLDRCSSLCTAQKIEQNFMLRRIDCLWPPLVGSALMIHGGIGTPEFMAPEVYEEEYNELVDIYSFGMCILEMVTFEYPYSECSHPAQIYKKVISGKKPDALYRVNDPEVRQFVEKCLATVSDRHSAWELLNDPFLQIDDYIYDLRQLSYQRDNDEVGPILRQPLLSAHHSTTSSLVNGYSNYLNYEREHDLDCHSVKYEANEIDLFTSQEDDQLENVDITIKGRRGDNDYIFLRLRIADKEGRFRNIYFPFDIETDTAWSVATEMIAELDITDQDVTKIAEMIDGEIASLVPEWKRELPMEESPNNYCQNCVLDVPMVGSLSSHKSGKNWQVLQCSNEHRCGAMHGRFEEITDQCEASEQCVTDGAPMDSSQSDGTQYTDAWAKNSGPDSSFQVFGDNSETSEQSTNDDDQISVRLHRENRSNYQDSTTTNPEALTEDNEQDKRQELRWLKAKYQIQLRELRDQQLGIVSKTSHSGSDSKQRKKDHSLLVSSTIKGEKGPECGLKSFNSGKHSSLVYPLDSEKNDINQNDYSYESAYNSCSPVHMVTAKSFYSSTLLPHSLHRATSLPVDATDF